MLAKVRTEEVTRLCQVLIQQKSYSGSENLVASQIKETFETLGYDEIIVDEYGNIIGHMKGKRPGKSILLDGHIDTVPVPDPAKWQHDPFAGEVEAGRIYGRGASDMKGAVSAMILAVHYFAQDCQHDFAGDIYVAGVVHEECFEGIAARAISKRVKPDYVVIGEASELNLKRGQRGRAEIIIETEGKSAHSANPQMGINAVYKMANLIAKLCTLPMTNHPVLGQGILELTDIKSSPYPGASVVPDLCRATYDRRLLVGETKENVLAPILNLIDECQREDPKLQAKAYFSQGEEKCYTGNHIAGERFFRDGCMTNRMNLCRRLLQDCAMLV